MDALPQNNLWLVMPAYVTLVTSCTQAHDTSIGLVLFLAALDISIVSTALPTIAEDLNATPSEYSWVGTVRPVTSALPPSVSTPNAPELTPLPVLPPRLDDHDPAQRTCIRYHRP
jgi:hypothetical protein